MSTVIGQQCATLLDQSSQSTTNDKLRAFFDAVATELTKPPVPTSNLDGISQTVTALLTVDKKLFAKQSQLIDHPLLVILRDCLIRSLFNPEAP